MKRRDFLHALAFSSVLATGVVNASAPAPIKFDSPAAFPGFYLPSVTLPNGVIETQAIVGKGCQFKSLDEVTQWMQTNTWDALKVIVNTNGVSYTLQDCMAWLPANFIEKKISLLLQVYEPLRFIER